MAKKRMRKSSSRKPQFPPGPPLWPFLPAASQISPKLQEAMARLLLSRAESWGNAFRAMADIADEVEEALRKAGAKSARGLRATNRRRAQEW
jgi:hypothetical protein